jgi:ABC-type sugar transport system ATPase subunit
MATAVEFRDVSKSYGSRTILNGLNLSIETNTFTVVFGPPASGKSVLLRLLTGLEKPDTGKIFLRGKDVSRVTPGDRNIGYVPQSFALYPHYTVFDNIAYPLNLMGVSGREIRPVVERTAELLKITHLLGKKPDQCSGGEKQRVAIARGIVKNTDIFVLDDPLTGLDFKLREQLFDDLRGMKDSLNATFIYTTSDPLEAMMLGEHLRVFDGGKIVEAGALETVYECPMHLRTMSLFGFPQANIFSGSLNGGSTCHTPLFTFPVQTDGRASGEAVQVAVRPQDVHVNPTNTTLLTCPANITLVEDLGGEQVVYLEAGGVPLVAVVRHDEADLTEGEATIGVHPSAISLYASATGERIGQGGG